MNQLTSFQIHARRKGLSDTDIGKTTGTIGHHRRPMLWMSDCVAIKFGVGTAAILGLKLHKKGVFS